MGGWVVKVEERSIFFVKYASGVWPFFCFFHLTSGSSSSSAGKVLLFPGPFNFHAFSMSPSRGRQQKSHRTFAYGGLLPFLFTGAGAGVAAAALANVENVSKAYIIFFRLHRVQQQSLRMHPPTHTCYNIMFSRHALKLFQHPDHSCTLCISIPGAGGVPFLFTCQQIL